MKKYPFKTNGVYVRNILPKSLRNYKPFLDSNKYWYATNYEDNMSSYEILWFDVHEGSNSIEQFTKATLDTKTGELMSIVDDYTRPYRFATFDVVFEDKKFEFGNDEIKIRGSQNPFNKDDILDILEVSIIRKSDSAFYNLDGIYQNIKFRFIPFLR